MIFRMNTLKFSLKPRLLTNIEMSKNELKNKYLSNLLDIVESSLVVPFGGDTVFCMSLFV